MPQEDSLVYLEVFGLLRAEADPRQVTAGEKTRLLGSHSRSTDDHTFAPRQATAGEKTQLLDSHSRSTDDHTSVTELEWQLLQVFAIADVDLPQFSQPADGRRERGQTRAARRGLFKGHAVAELA